MKIKTIEYKKLISSGNFSNETVGFSVEPEANETPQQIIADLNLIIMNVHEYSIQLQTASDMVSHLAENIRDEKDSIRLQQYLHSLGELLNEYKHTIEQLTYLKVKQ